MLPESNGQRTTIFLGNDAVEVNIGNLEFNESPPSEQKGKMASGFITAKFQAGGVRLDPRKVVIVKTPV